MRSLKSFCIIGLAVVLLAALTGCVTNMSLKPAIWKDTSAKIGIAVETLPTAGAHKAGSQGALDILINDAVTAPLQKHLATTDLNAFLSVKQQLAAVIEKRGLQAKVIEDPIDISSLPMVGNSDNGTRRPDYEVVANKYHVNYLLLLKINAVGTVRKYYGFIPLGDPAGYCQANGQLIQAATGTPYWSYTTNDQQSRVPIKGNWNDPPNYPEVDAAVQTAIHNAVDFLVSNFK